MSPRWVNNFRVPASCYDIQLYFNSDLDVVVRLANVEHQEDKKRTLFQLSAALKASGVTKYTRVNHYARVPVVIFQTEPDFGPSALKFLNSFITY